MLIGSSAGGGYDLFARTIATHWSRHIPGNPNIVPQNVPGALSLQVANNIFSIAPRDGTVIGAVNPQIASRAVLDAAAARFDARQFTWIGSALREYQVMVARTDAAVKTFDDAFQDRADRRRIGRRHRYVPDHHQCRARHQVQGHLRLSGHARSQSRDGSQRGAGQRRDHLGQHQGHDDDDAGGEAHQPDRSVRPQAASRSAARALCAEIRHDTPSSGTR